MFVAQDGGPWTVWLSQTSAASGIYNGQAGHTYRFLALATDNAGNREQPPVDVQAPDDGSHADLGALPAASQTTPQDIGTPPAPSRAILLRFPPTYR